MRDRLDSYLKFHSLTERNAYIRLRELHVLDIAGFRVPFLHNYVDDLFALEMTVVSPPYLLDFASAKLDSAHDVIEDEGHTLADLIRERFDDRADEVIALIAELGEYAGVYLTDVHAHNIKFAPPPPPPRQ